MFSPIQDGFKCALSYLGYGPDPVSQQVEEGFPKKIYNQEHPQSTLQARKITPIESPDISQNQQTSIWQNVMAFVMGYLVFSHSQSSSMPNNLRGTINFAPLAPAVHALEPWALPLTIFAGLSAFPGMADAQATNTTFFETFGLPSSERGYTLTTTSEGKLIVGGYSAIFGAGDVEALITELSSNGTLVRATIFGGSDNDQVRALTTTPDGKIIAAGYTFSYGTGIKSDLSLAKFSSNSTLLWDQTFGGENSDAASAVMIDENGDIIVTGSTDILVENFSDLLLAKFSSDGGFLWGHTLGGAAPAQDQGLALLSITQGEFIVAGETQLGAGADDVLLAMFSSSGGTLLWANAQGGGGDDRINALAATSDGNFVGVGYTSSYGAGSRDILVAKYSSNNGTVFWSNTLGGASFDEGNAIMVTSKGEIAITGFTSSFGAGGEDLLYATFSSDGTYLEAYTLGGSNDEVGHGLTATPDGNFFIAGETNSFGSGNNDVLVAKINAKDGIDNCSAWQRITPQVQSITPTFADVTSTIVLTTPAWMIQDVKDLTNVTDITALLGQTAECYTQPKKVSSSSSSSVQTQSQLNQDTGTSSSAILSSNTSNSSSTQFYPSLTPAPSSFASLTSHSTRRTPFPTFSSSTSLQAPSTPSTTTLSSEASSLQVPSTSGESMIPSIKTLVYGVSYPITVNGESVGTFYFTGGTDQLNSGNTNTLNLQFSQDIEDGSTIILFTIPDGEEAQWEGIVVNTETLSECSTLEGEIISSEDENKYQLTFEYQSSECTNYAAVLKLPALVSGGVL